MDAPDPGDGLGTAIVAAVASWADDARAVISDLNEAISAHHLDDEEVALVSHLTGASDLTAVASELVDAAERLTAASPPAQ